MQVKRMYQAAGYSRWESFNSHLVLRISGGITVEARAFYNRTYGFLRFFHLDNKGGACGGTHFTSEDNLLMRRRFSVIDGCPTRYTMMQAIRV